MRVPGDRPRTSDAYVETALDPTGPASGGYSLLVSCAAGVSVVPIFVGDSKRCVALTNALLKRGIDVQPILYPGVRERAVRLRFFINGTHTEDQIRWTIGIVEEEWRRFGGRPV